MRDTSFRKLKMPPRKRNVKNVNLATKASAVSDVARFDLPDPPELDKQIEIANVVEETSQQDIVTEAAGVPEVMAVEEDQTINRNVKRKRRMPLNLTEDQEQDVADWYRDHEILYNRRLKEYKDTKAKMHLFEKKAASMEPICTGDQLKVWIHSMRTLVGKITSKKSGDKARPRTDREDWVMQQFGYLENHIKRVVCPRKKGGQLEKNLPCPSKTTSDTDEGNTSDGEEEEKTEESDTSTICYTNRRFKKPKKNDRSPSSTKPSTASSIEALLGRADKVHKHLQERMQSRPTDSLSQTKRHFVEMIYHEIMQMDEMAWMDYQTQSFQVLMQFKQSRLQRSHQQLNALPRHLLVSHLPQTASHPSVQSFHHPSPSYSTHHAVDTKK